MNTILDQIVDRLTTVHNCHTIILSGSRAAGDATASSDYDLCAFRDDGETIRDCNTLNGVILDAWIYAEGKALARMGNNNARYMAAQNT